MDGIDQLRLFISRAPSAQALFDRDMRYLAWSDRWIADYGLDPDTDYQGQSHYSVFPEIGDDWKAVHQRCLAGEIESTDLEPFVRSDGRTQWLRYEVRPWYTTDQAIGGLVMLTEDLTETVEAQRALARESALLNAAVMNAPVLLFTLDTEGRVTLRRGQLIERTGTDDPSLIGMRLVDRFPDDAVVAEGVDRALGGETASWAYRVAGRSIETTLVPLRDTDGSVTGAIGVAVDVTDRDEATVERTQSDALLEAARHADATVWAFDADRRMTLHVGAPLEALGVGQGWNVGEDMADVYADLPIVIDAVDRALRGERSEWNVVVDGRTFESVLTPMVGADGVARGGVGISIDITDRLRAEASSVEQVGRLRALADAFTVQGELDAIEEVLGTLRRLLGLDIALFSHITPEDDRYRVVSRSAPREVEIAPGDEFSYRETYCNMTFEAKAVVTIDHMAESDYRRHPCYAAFGLEAYIGAPVTVDGEPFGTLNLSSPEPRTVPFTDADRELVRLAARWIGSLVERDLRQRKLEGSERRFQGIFNSQYQFQGLLSPDGTLLEANDTAVAFAGVPREELVGKKFWDCSWWQISQEAQDQLKEAVEQAVGGEFVRYTVEVQGAGDTVVPIDFSLKPLVDEATGEVVLLIPEGRDVSEMVAAEGRLRDTVDALAEARDQAEAASRAKSAFLASMSHEIRTPMNAVIGFGELLATTGLDARQHEYVQTIQRAGDRLLGLIDDILDFSKIEAGRIDLDETPIQIRDVVRRSLKEAAAQAVGNGIELAYSVDAAVPDRVLADEKRIQQVLANLISNAVKFTHSGTVDLVVRLATPLPDAEPPADAVWVEIEVRDTGIGIAADRLASIFDPFVQADTSMTRAYGGAGLGLAITRRFVELMGGRVLAESTEGAGSTFRVVLPLRPVATSGRVVLNDAIDGMSGASVLVVDDDDDGRAALVARLSRWGLRVRDTADPAEGLRWVAAGESFDVGVLDMVMPETDGLALAEAIREHRTPVEMPLVVLSSEDRIRHAPDLVTATVLKPIAPSALHALLRRVLDYRGRPSSGTPRPSPQPAVPRAAAAELAGALGVGPEAQSALRILLAEDEPDNQALALQMLSQLGYRAEVAADGAEALERLHQHAYDVVLMDVMMPLVDGLEATRRLRRELPDDRQPHVIALTARALRSDREACLAAGMDGYLSKPVRLDALATALRATPGVA